jgi:hypothetical protein
MGGYNMEANHTANAMAASPIAAIRLAMTPLRLPGGGLQSAGAAWGPLTPSTSHH